MERSTGPAEGASEPSPAELAPHPVGLCAGTALHQPGWIHLSWRGMSVCPTAPENGPSCVAGMRTKPTQLCCGLGFPAMAVFPEVLPPVGMPMVWASGTPVTLVGTRAPCPLLGCAGSWGELGAVCAAI